MTFTNLLVHVDSGDSGAGSAPSRASRSSSGAGCQYSEPSRSQYRTIASRTVASPLVFSCSGPAFELTPETLERDVGPRLVALVGNVAHALEAARGA